MHDYHSKVKRSVGTSEPIKLNVYDDHNHGLTLVAVIDGQLSVTVEASIDPIDSKNPVFFALDDMAELYASKPAIINFPISMLRLNVVNYVSGQVELKVRHAL